MKNPNMVIDVNGKILHFARADLSALVEAGQIMKESPAAELPGPVQDCYFDKGKILYLPTDADKLAAGKITQSEIDTAEVERLIAEKQQEIAAAERRQQAIDTLKAEGVLTEAGTLKK